MVNFNFLKPKLNPKENSSTKLPETVEEFPEVWKDEPLDLSVEALADDNHRKNVVSRINELDQFAEHFNVIIKSRFASVWQQQDSKDRLKKVNDERSELRRRLQIFREANIQK